MGSERQLSIKSRSLTEKLAVDYWPETRIWITASLDQNPNIQRQIIKPFHDARLQDHFY